MSALTPNDVTAVLADIVDTIISGVTVGEGRATFDGGTFHKESLDRAYRWFHGAAYHQRAGAGGSARLCVHCHGSGFRLDTGKRCEACTPRAGHDPTGDTIVSQRDLQDKLGEVSRSIISVRIELHRAVAGLRACETIVDRSTDRTLPNERAIPRTATTAELDLARAAQSRRLERGEVT